MACIIVKEVQSLVNAFTVLEVFSLEEPELSLSAICSKTQMNKTNVFRYLKTLMSMGYVQQNKDTQKYSLGFKFFYLGSIVGDSMDLRKVAHDEMKELHSEIGEAIGLFIMNNYVRTCIDYIESNRDVRATLKIGGNYTLSGGGGRPFFFNRDNTSTSSILAKSGLNDREIQKCLQQIEKDRKLGYAISLEENVKGIFGVSAPIYDAENTICASFQVVCAISDYTEYYAERLGKMVVKSTRTISQRLGARL